MQRKIHIERAELVKSLTVSNQMEYIYNVDGGEPQRAVFDKIETLVALLNGDDTVESIDGSCVAHFDGELDATDDEIRKRIRRL